MLRISAPKKMNTNWEFSDNSEAVSEAESAVSVTGKPRATWKRAIWTCFKEYCINSSVHGARYLGESKRPLSERIWWMIVFAISLFCCGNLILKVWQKWDASPVIVSFAERSTPVWQIPFPAVTICSENKARQGVFNFTEAFHFALAVNRDNMTEEAEEIIKKLQAVSLVCDSHLVTDGSKTGDNSIVDILEEVAPQFDEMMWQCKWKNSDGNCSKFFNKILTEEGVCYTFNVLDASELFRKEAIQDDYPYLNHGKKSQGWTLQNGYPPNLDSVTYPHRGPGAGAKEGLVILLKAFEHDLDYLCKGPVQGFKVLLHHPAEIPRLSQQYFRVPLNQEVVVSVKPNMMTTSEGLHHYPPHRRQCYFPFERNLHFYQLYTQTNCELECLTNHTLHTCGCVIFSMPRNKSMPICGSGSTECVWRAQAALQAREIAQELRSGEEQPGNTGRTDCDCLPSCTSIQYEAEFSQALFNWERLFRAYKVDFSELPNVTMARVSIYFKQAQFITSRRSELYGQTDFLANCGGLLGLFMGVSILSFVEIIYFLTLRLYCTLQIKARKIRGKQYPKPHLADINIIPPKENKE